MSNLSNLPKTVHLNSKNGPVNVHEYLVWALGTQVKGHMLPLHPGKRCNHSEMIASSDIEDTVPSSLNTNWGFMKTIGQLHGFDYLSWVVQLPPWLVICKRIMVKVMLEQQSDSPFGLPQVTSVSPAGLVPAKRALLSLNLARKVRSLTNDGTRNRKIIFRGEVELSLVFSAVGPLLSSIFQCSSLWTGPCEIKIQKNTFTPGHPVALGALNLKAGRESSCKQSKAPSPPDVYQVMHYRKVSMFKQKHNLNELTRHIWRHRRTSSHPQTLCNVFLHQIFVVIAL